MTSQEVLVSKNLAPEYFASGVTILKNKIFQLTWKESIILVYNRETLELIEKVSLEINPMVGI